MKNDNKETLIAAVVVLLIVTVSFLLYLYFSGSSEPYSEMRYTVQCGDTLDGLYYRYGGGALEKWRYDMKKVNGMSESGLYIGDEIIVLADDYHHNDNSEFEWVDGNVQ